MSQLLHLRECDSTQRVARDLDTDGDWGLVWSDRQTEGRGRENRRWVSESGGLYYTLRYPSRDFEASAHLQTIGAALLWVRVIRRCLDGRPDVGIKWPNDLVLGGRKLGGLLGETSGDVVHLGIGINVNNTFSHPEEMRHPPVSLREVRGEPYSRRRLLFTWLRGWIAAAGASDHSGLFDPEAIEERMRTLGKRVRTDGSEGEAVGLAPDGGLVLDTGRETRTVHAGDVVEVPYG